MRRAARWCIAAAAIASTAATAHTIINAALLRRPSTTPPPLATKVSILLPVRDEEHRVEPCLRSLLAQTASELEIVIVDDNSTDRTAEVVKAVANGDPRVRLISGNPLPPGWLGKPYACAQAARHADPASEVLVFVDADVILVPHAIESTVDLLLATGLDLVSPYPRQVNETIAERLVQPLLQWSWLTFLPLRLAEKSAKPSLSAANGQLIAVRRGSYQKAGGHQAVATEVIEDIALLRAIKRTGGRGVVVDGTALASCRMYDGAAALADGYGKSLWAAFGSPAGAAAVTSALAAMYVLPAVAALAGNPIGLVGYLAGVAGRIVAARTTGGRVFPDTLAHPASIAALTALTARSWCNRGKTRWKGRSV